MAAVAAGGDYPSDGDDSSSSSDSESSTSSISHASISTRSSSKKKKRKGKKSRKSKDKSVSSIPKKKLKKGTAGIKRRIKAKKNGICIDFHSCNCSDEESYDGSDSDSSMNSTTRKLKSDDKEYRTILKALTKSAKYYKMKDLSMNDDPILRREKFNIWVTDLRNILSTHHKTSGLLDKYPAHLSKFNDNVDRAIQTLLFSITTGMAKRIVSQTKSAFASLVDLRRNYGQTSKLDAHREKVKMMSMKQSQENASTFLRRLRKQMYTCQSVGCFDYDKDTGHESLVNIALEGFRTDIWHYSATIAELKATYRRNPDSITLVYLEEVFFNLDDSLPKNFQFQRRRESANFIKTDDSTKR